MRRYGVRIIVGAAAMIAGLSWNGTVPDGVAPNLMTAAQARIGMPATPLSYAGVARRSPVTPGVPAAGGAGGPASGIGVLPGAGAGQAGVGYSAGVPGAPAAGGVGGPASGVGALPGAGAGQAGAGYSAGPGVNLGGPANRPGAR